MSAWELPTSLNISGVDWQIRTDYRAILDILKYFSDPEYNDYEKFEICMTIFYVDYENMPTKIKEEAFSKAIDFIDMGMKEDKKQELKLMDWEYDAPVIIPSINKVIGKEIRSIPYLHWWTFMGAYMEIGEGLFAQIINVRRKKQKGFKKEDKWEKQFYKENKRLVDIPMKKTKEELDLLEREKRAIEELIG